MKKYNILGMSLIILTLCSVFSCKAQQAQANIATEIVATWIAEDDTKVKLVFNSYGTYLSYYNSELIGTYSYFISHQCGNESDNRVWFLRTVDQEDSDERCYELYGANGENNNTLSMRDMTTGKIFIYNKN